MKLIDVNDLGSFAHFRGRRGKIAAEFLLKLISIDRVNEIYYRNSRYTGTEFTSHLLNGLGVTYSIGNAERLRSLPEGAFITISNHPYGGIDGIMLVDLFAGIRRDYRLMVNKLLSMVRTLEGNFISVDPAGNKKKGISGESLNGIRETLSRLRDGHPVGFFPSGAVSDLSLKDRCIRDRKWQDSVIHLIRKAEVPILPVRFFDRNSALFYLLGLIDWRVRVLRQPSELFNKKGHQARIGLGRVITVEEQSAIRDYESFGAFLRKAVYEMPLPDRFIPYNFIRSELASSPVQEFSRAE